MFVVESFVTLIAECKCQIHLKIKVFQSSPKTKWYNCINIEATSITLY